MRDLLTLGNQKLGSEFHIWSLPAIETCPGRTTVCESHCYGLKHRYRFPVVESKLESNYRASLQPNFASRLGGEINRGSVASPCEYIVSATFMKPYQPRIGLRSCVAEKVRIFCFDTRTWRIAVIRRSIEAMAKLSNCTATNANDSESGSMSGRLASVQVEKNKQAWKGDLVYQVPQLKEFK